LVSCSSPLSSEQSDLRSRTLFQPPGGLYRIDTPRAIMVAGYLCGSAGDCDRWSRVISAENVIVRCLIFRPSEPWTKFHFIIITHRLSLCRANQWPSVTLRFFAAILSSLSLSSVSDWMEFPTSRRSPFLWLLISDAMRGTELHW
jgi:hypothetical protein